MKKRKINWDDVYTNIWTSIAKQCEWPEKSALRMVCKKAYKGITINIIHTSYEDWWMTHNPIRRYLPILYIKKIKLIVNEADMEMWALARKLKSIVDIVKDNRMDELYKLGQIFHPTIARFARSHNYIKHLRPKNWSTYFK